jgi:hypothetical protein
VKATNLNSFIDRYFSIIKDNFGIAYDIAAKNNFDQQKYMPILEKLYTPELIKITSEIIFEELKSLDWSSQEKSVKNANGLKVHYLGGEYVYKKSPSAISNFLKRTALYADTIVFEEQVFGHLLHAQNFGIEWKNYFGYILNDAINYLEQEQFFYSDSDAPICLLAPTMNLNPERSDVRGKNWTYMREVTAVYAKDLFDIDFKSFTELENFLSTKKSDKEFLESIINGKKLFTQDGIEVDEPLIQELRGLYPKDTPRAWFYEVLLLGQNSDRIFDLEYNGKLGTVPITDYRVAWDSILWLMQFDNNSILKMKKNVTSKDALIMRALNEEQKFIGNVPLKGLKMLRDNGEMADLRELIGRNIREIENASDDEFIEVGKLVSYNIETALRKHSFEVQGLNERYNRLIGFTSAGVVTSVVSGSIGFVASAYQPLALAAGILGGIPLGIQTVKQYLELRDKNKELQTKPVAVLFEKKGLRNEKLRSELKVFSYLRKEWVRRWTLR